MYLNTRLRHGAELVFANNTIIEPTTGFGLRSSESHRTSATVFRIYDNLFVGVEASRVLVFDGETAGETLDSLNNLEDAAQLYFTSAAGAGFVDPAQDDYRLRADSPARDTGAHTGFLGVVTDLRGIPRDSQYDVGALEYVP